MIKLFFGLDGNPYGGWYVKDRGQLEKINELLTDDNLAQWKTILTAELVTSQIDFLSTESDSLSAYGSSDEKEYAVCMKIASKLFYDELSDLYTEKYYTPETDSAVREMCDTLRDSYRELIGSADWLTEDGRAALLRKLENMQFILPHTTAVNDPSRAALIRESYPKTLRAIRERAYDDNAKNIGAAFDMTRPGLAAYEVNAR
ncbi:Peptidase family M13 [Ruminococcus sp. YE71]|uniref:hypothetical protein n=1 Tax=unclassified Ruminococcus TaxID=2608920 RepID=UPI00088C2B80|nr:MULTISPECIES: hypothetical protein [unclassified Ruminococcus]SDA10111.1 Peptidase family M13 [Ruminococcus sp. YE78]SFW11088.1 Peptidase family M13 [Ruminococcus sp. YE71]